MIRGVIKRLGFRSNALIVNDALIALVAGAGPNPGVVLVSGTGSIAYGVSHRRVAARAGGWGPTLGDEGSGYWIGRRALAAVMREVDGRGPSTSLSAMVLEHFAVARPEMLVAEIYHQPQGRRTIAGLASVVDRARAAGDPVAFDIMRHASEELALAAGSVITRLEMRGEPFPILLAGGVLRESPWLADDLRERLLEVAPRSTVGRLTHEPALGAVTLALAHARGGVHVPPYLDTLRATSSREHPTL